MEAKMGKQTVGQASVDDFVPEGDDVDDFFRDGDEDGREKDETSAAAHQQSVGTPMSQTGDEEARPAPVTTLNMIYLLFYYTFSILCHLGRS